MKMMHPRHAVGSFSTSHQQQQYPQHQHQQYYHYENHLDQKQEDEDVEPNPFQGTTHHHYHPTVAPSSSIRRTNYESGAASTNSHVPQPQRLQHHQQQQQHHHHHQVSQRPSFPSHNNTQRQQQQPQQQANLAAAARQEWQQLGVGASQALEEQRMATNSLLSPPFSSAVSQESQPSSLQVRVIAAQTRRDMAEKEYTAYVIQVVTATNTTTRTSTGTNSDTATNNHQRQEYYNHHLYPPSHQEQQQQQSASSISNNNIKNKSWIVEHRYSDFAKLHELLQTCPQLKPHYCTTNTSNSKSNSNNTTAVTFPSKSWAGRMGNWTPSAVLSPKHYEELIQSRIAQLDIWLVHVVHLVLRNSSSMSQDDGQHNNNNKNHNNNTLNIPRNIINAVHDFLKQGTPALPCHLEQDLQISSSLSSTTTTSARQHRAQWNPIGFTMGSAIRQACWTLQKMCRCGYDNSSYPDAADANGTTRASDNHNDQIYLNHHNNNDCNNKANPLDQSIPLDLLRAAKGILFLAVVKGGLVVSGRVGTGLLVKRLDENDNDHGSSTRNGTGYQDDNHDNNNTAAPASSHWSAPVAMGTLGIGWGALAGGDVTHYMVILTTDKAVHDLACQQSVQLGAELSVAVGPVGRGANSHLQTGDWTLHQAYAYAHSRGLFVGMSIEGSLLQVRRDVNAKFYGAQQEKPELLLSTPGPKAARPLYEALDKALRVELHRHSFRPTRLLNLNGENDENHQVYYRRDPSSSCHSHQDSFFVDYYRQSGGGGEANLPLTGRQHNDNSFLTTPSPQQSSITFFPDPAEARGASPSSAQFNYY